MRSGIDVGGEGLTVSAQIQQKSVQSGEGQDSRSSPPNLFINVVMDLALFDGVFSCCSTGRSHP